MQEIDISVEEAFKLVMSAGLVSPDKAAVPADAAAARAATPEVTAAEIRPVRARK